MKKSRYTVSLPVEIDEVIKNLATKSGVPAATIIRGLILLQHTELTAFNTWFSDQSEESNQFKRGVHTLEEPGPATLMQDAKEIERQNGDRLLFGLEALQYGNSAVAVLPAGRSDSFTDKE